LSLITSFLADGNASTIKATIATTLQIADIGYLPEHHQHLVGWFPKGRSK